MSNTFKKNKEDFTCIHCHTKVQGNGYTNHCPVCLTSLHVDINPGDRASSCQGIMLPIGIEIKKGQYYIIHQCSKCGHIKKNKAAKEDDFSKILSVVKQENEKIIKSR